MFTANLLIALLLNAVTFLVHAGGLIMLTRAVEYALTHPLLNDRKGAKVVAILLLASGLFVILALEIGIWAAAMVGLGAFDDFETAFYVSTSAFATIGFGDVQPAEDWRLLAALEGATGFLIIGWTAAYLVTSSIRFGPFERDTHF